MIMNVLLAIVGFILKLMGKTPSVQQQLGQAQVAAESQENARAEVAQAVDARRDVDARRLRDEGAGPVTTDPGAPVNRDDGFRRD